MANIRNQFDSGFNGSTFASTTSAKTGSWYAIQVVADAVFSSITGNVTGDSIVGVTLPTGFIVYGGFTAFQLSSGKVIAYSY